MSHYSEDMGVFLSLWDGLLMEKNEFYFVFNGQWLLQYHKIEHSFLRMLGYVGWKATSVFITLKALSLASHGRTITSILSLL